LGKIKKKKELEKTREPEKKSNLTHMGGGGQNRKFFKKFIGEKEIEYIS